MTVFELAVLLILTVVTVLAGAEGLVCLLSGQTRGAEVAGIAFGLGILGGIVFWREGE